MSPDNGAKKDVLALQTRQGALPLTFFAGLHEVGDDTVDCVSVHLRQGLWGGRDRN